MTNAIEYRTTRCPVCETGFKYPYHDGQTLYTMTCRKAACATKFMVDITPYLTNKVTLLRGTPQSETVLALPDQLIGTVVET